MRQQFYTNWTLKNHLCKRINLVTKPVQIWFETRKILPKDNYQISSFLLWHQSTYLTTRFVFPIFFTNFSFWAVEKDNQLFTGAKQIIFLSITTMQWKVCFLFQLLNCSTEKILGKTLVKTRFVVWWFDVTNWLLGLRCHSSCFRWKSVQENESSQKTF